jgi:hypothetical protein
MAEYINRDLIVKNSMLHTWKKADLLRAIKEAPTADVVEVVRCKECEYGSSEDYKNLYTCDNYPDGIGGYVDGNCFCSYGERRDT